MIRARHSAPAFGFLAAALVARSAAADPTRVSTPVVRWNAPSGCPSQPFVQAEAEQAVANALQGSDPAAPPAVPRLDADVGVRDDGGPDRWFATISLTDKTGSHVRTVKAPRCVDLVEAAMVMLRIAAAREPMTSAALGASTGTGAVSTALLSTLPSASADATARAPDAPESKREPLPPPSSSEPVPDHRLHFALFAGPRADWGAVPAPVASFEAGFRVAWHRVSLEPYASTSLLAEARNATKPAEGATFSSKRLGARACVSLGDPALAALFLCALGTHEWISADGFGAQENLRSSTGVWRFGGGALVERRIASFLIVRAGGEVSAPVSRPTFYIDRTGSVYEQPALGASLSLSAVALLPWAM